MKKLGVRGIKQGMTQVFNPAGEAVPVTVLEMDPSLFQAGELVDVRGVTKGRGFQGVIKRHGKAGGPDSHGASKFHRRPGSIGMRTWPGRVLKNMRLPGRMGMEKILVKNLLVVDANKEKNCLLLRGAVPGPRKRVVTVYKEGAPAPEAKAE